MKKDTFKKLLWLVTYAVILYLLLQNLKGVGGFLELLLGVAAPIIFGAILAFLLNIPMRFLEEKALKRLWEKHPKLAKGKRAICMIITYILVLAVLTVVVIFAVTQLSGSVSNFVDELPTYTREAEQFAKDLALRLGLAEDVWHDWVERIGDVWTLISNYAKDVVSFAYKLITGVVSGAFTVLVGLIFSAYALASKESLTRIFRRLIAALIPQRFQSGLERVSSEAYHNLTSFFGGQLIEALIIGVLCLIGMLILGIPYAPLVSTIVAITNIIPIFGPWIGGGFAAIIILLESPVKALIFVIFVAALQQLESNLIYPRVVGKAVGLPGLWVFVAITIGGGLFGLLGMLFAVPVMATVYNLLAAFTNGRLRTRHAGDENGEPPSPEAPEPPEPPQTQEE